MLKKSPQRDHLFVHPGPGAVVAHFGMDGIGKINGRGPFGQHFYLALRGKNINLVGKQIDTDRFQKLPGILHFLRIQELSDPFEFFGIGFIEGLPFFVLPVGGNPFFSHPVHFLGPDLNLDPLSERTDDLGMERLILIGFR